MIIAACGGRGNGEKNAEGLARAESGEGSGKWEVGEGDRKKGGWGGVDGNREGGGGGDREGESGRGQRGGRDVEGSNRDGKRLAMERGTR